MSNEEWYAETDKRLELVVKDFGKYFCDKELLIIRNFMAIAGKVGR